MKQTAIVFLWIIVGVAAQAQANATCVSVLTDRQQLDLDAMIFPSARYSPILGEADGGDPVQGPVKRLTMRDIERSRASPTPRVVVGGNILSEQEVAPLKEWLKSNAATDVPAYESMHVGIAVPSSWLQLTPDDFLRLMDQAGDAGRVRTTTLGTTAVQGRALGVIEQVAINATGQLKFLWNYLYEVTFGGRLITVPLTVCQADVVTVVQNPSQSSVEDEQELVAIQQQLAHAWVVRDRAVVERLLAPEWAVTTPEGAKMSRASVLAMLFDSTFQSVTTDDVTVTQFGLAAVVRGRTTIVHTVADSQQTTTVRFTDFCIKRRNTWQLVSSHQSRLPR